MSLGELRAKCLYSAEQSKRRSLSQSIAHPLSRRAQLAALALLPALQYSEPCVAAAPAQPVNRQDGTASASTSAPDTTITHRVYLDVGFCPAPTPQDRSLGDISVCKDIQPAGRIVIGLYGRFVPQTVANFLATVHADSYSGTVFNKVVPGAYISAGRQGSLRKGEVQAPRNLPSNPETLQSSAYRLQHFRPGTVSLSISENDDAPAMRLTPGYRNTQFLITTGPGPANDLDGQNVVFGRVLSGFEIVNSVAQVQTFQIRKDLQWINDFANRLGDDRAAKAKAKWTRPVKPIVITACGELQDGASAVA